MYTTHRIPDSPNTPPPERPPVARRASESSGGSENHLEVAFLNYSRGTMQEGRNIKWPHRGRRSRRPTDRRFPNSAHLPLQGMGRDHVKNVLLKKILLNT